MAFDEQEKPLAPTSTIIHHRFPVTVDEELSTELRKQRQGFRTCTVCCGVITAVMLIIAVVMLVLGFTILHVKNPKINMNSVTITGLDRMTNSTTQLGSNLTVVAHVSIKNSNFAAFRFEKSNTSLLYHDTVVGVSDVPRGVVKARKTVRLNVTFEVSTTEMALNQEFGSELSAGILPLESHTKINGRVKILNIIKRKVSVTMNCFINVNVTSREIVNQDCKRRVTI